MQKSVRVVLIILGIAALLAVVYFFATYASVSLPVLIFLFEAIALILVVLAMFQFIRKFRQWKKNKKRLFGS